MTATGPIGIAIGLVSAGLAAANLLIDFSFLKDASRQRLPKWMEVGAKQRVLLCACAFIAPGCGVAVDAAC